MLKKSFIDEKKNFTESHEDQKLYKFRKGTQRHSDKLKQRNVPSSSWEEDGTGADNGLKSGETIERNLLIN